MKEIKIVEVGNYVCAIKLGRCPLFAVEHIQKKEDMIEGLKEDFPGFIISNGGQKERAEAAKRIIMQRNMNAADNSAGFLFREKQNANMDRCKF